MGFCCQVYGLGLPTTLAFWQIIPSQPGASSSNWTHLVFFGNTRIAPSGNVLDGDVVATNDGDIPLPNQ